MTLATSERHAHLVVDTDFKVLRFAFVELITFSKLHGVHNFLQQSYKSTEYVPKKSNVTRIISPNKVN